MSDRVGVIGGGLGGLAAACTLAARGHSVVLFEKNDWLGGKAAVLEQDGFRFDMGPTILTVPAILERVFREAGRELDDYVELIRLDPQWRCFFDDGSVLDLQENQDAMLRSLDRFSPASGASEGWRDFMAVAERLHAVSQKFFFWKPVEDLRDTIDLKANMNASTLSDVMSLRMGQTVAGTIRSRVSDERVAQMLDHFTQYVGSSPYASPAVLCAIAHMQVQGGVWYPVGGTAAVTDALVRLGSELGVDFRTAADVQRVMVENGRACGVALASGEEVRLRAVVSNMDSIRTYDELVGGGLAQSFHKRRAFEPACSGVVLYLGLKQRYEHLLHHDFVFSRDAEEEFDYIYRLGHPAPDPTCYLAAPAVTDPDVAPKGGEALYVLVHTPYLHPHHNWQDMLPRYRQTILEKLKRTAGLTDIEDRIVTESVLTPQDIHDRYRVSKGAIYGLASHGRFMGAFKPGNRSRDLPGLYLCGGSAHPGPGMPMVMMSGWIAGDTVDQDLGGRTRSAA